MGGAGIAKRRRVLVSNLKCKMNFIPIFGHTCQKEIRTLLKIYITYFSIRTLSRRAILCSSFVDDVFQNATCKELIFFGAYRQKYSAVRPVDIFIETTVDKERKVY